jgi:hypothetical protein
MIINLILFKMPIEKLMLKEKPEMALSERFLEQIIKANPGINLTVKAGELLEFGNSIADRTVKTFLQKHDEKVYTRNEVIEKFKICSATLWRWDKMNLIESKKIGNRVFYPESEIKRLTNMKGES